MRELNPETRRQAFLQTVHAAQNEMFPEFAGIENEQLEMAGTGEHRYVQWAPTHHIRTGLVTSERVEELQQLDSDGMLVVGCGRALLERILVEKLGVPAKNVTLADKYKQSDVPSNLQFLPLDMTSDESWKKTVGSRKFKYIVFPESLIGALDVILHGLSAQQMENEDFVKSHALNFMVSIFVRAANSLAPEGEIIANAFGGRASLAKLRRIGLDYQLQEALPDFTLTITDNFIHLKHHP